MKIPHTLSSYRFKIPVVFVLEFPDQRSILYALPTSTSFDHSNSILWIQAMKHICAIYSSLLLKQSPYLTENEIIAIFWGECISSYGWRRDPAPLCGKGARFVPAIDNEHAILLSPMHNLYQTPTIPANKLLRKPKTKQPCSQPKPEEGLKLSTDVQ
jgi:hypothetical protein